MSSKKKLTPSQAREQESARLFGKHVTRQKGNVLLAVSLIACAMPMLLGVRYWDAIPEIVPTGLTLPNGEDDSLPRAMAVYGLPALLCILDLICHMQLKINQERMTLPKAPVRLMGRFGFPIVSTFLCGVILLHAAGRPFDLAFVTPCVLGLAFLMLGAHMFDCPKSAKLALRFSFTVPGDSWQAVHRFAGWTWLIAGLVVLAIAMTGLGGGMTLAAVVLIAGAAPFAYGFFRPTGLR